MIVHTVCFTLAHAPGSEAEASFLAEGRTVLPSIPGVRDFTVSRQVGSQSDFEWQFSMTFPDQETYTAYNEHPSHTGFVRERWAPEVAAFQEFDFVPVP